MNQPIDWEQEEARLAARSYAAGDPTGWFDQLYAAGDSGRVQLSWNRTHPHPLLAEWTTAQQIDGTGQHAIVVGCGLGADVAHLADHGFDATGFDVSPTAIRLASQRWRHTSATFVTADLLNSPPEWVAAFDLVVEIITVQAIPDTLRPQAIAAIANMVAPGGTLLVIAAIHDDSAPVHPTGPWPLRRAEIDAFATSSGLTTVRVETTHAPGLPEQPRWRAEFRRTA
ncbi:class I SAM-dependent methyltransferase [Fodinicola acaciae]|uniref:class I SAM-dependent methyltransferase n=1 Tax=Fodinicola acaciae TaxID=2681555 RepID=UPI0013D035BA|nr:class I SAM-dependent methyltransferase [Fodinicola acaciae]